MRCRSRSMSSTLTLNGLADLEHLGRVVDVAPGELGDVDQAVDALEVDEGAEIDDVRDRPLDDVAGREPVEDRLPHLLALVLEHGAAREDDVVAAAVQLDDLAAELLAEELVEVLHAADVDERGGRKPRTPRSRMRPPLTTSITVPSTGSPLSAAPSMRFQAISKRARFFERIKPALGVLLGHHERVDLVAELHLVGRVDRAADRELRDRDDAFGLVADVDEHLVLVDPDDGAADDLPLVDDGDRRVVVGNQRRRPRHGPIRRRSYLSRRSTRSRGPSGTRVF